MFSVLQRPRHDKPHGIFDRVECALSCLIGSLGPSSQHAVNVCLICQQLIVPAATGEMTDVTNWCKNSASRLCVTEAVFFSVQSVQAIATGVL